MFIFNKKAIKFTDKDQFCKIVLILFSYGLFWKNGEKSVIAKADIMWLDFKFGYVYVTNNNICYRNSEIGENYIIIPYEEFILKY